VTCDDATSVWYVHGSGSLSAVDAVVDLLGMLAYAELLAFDRTAADARLAPDLRRRAILSEMAAREITSYRRLADRLGVLGVDPEVAMAPYVGPLEEYHQQTQADDWFEGLTKAFVGDSIADDFTREVAVLLQGEDRDLVLDVLHDARYADFAAEEIRTGIQADPRLADRLSMWARRLVGEALSQAVHVATQRPALAMLLLGDGGSARAGNHAVDGFGPAENAVPAMFQRLSAAHAARMAAVGLNN